MEGGAIGLRATGSIALCVMAYWHIEFIKRLKQLDIEMDVYGGFVDDTLLLTDEIDKGTKIEDNELVVNSVKKQVDQNKSEEKVTIEILEEVAQSILKMIEVTSEAPSKFIDGKLRMLDVKIWVNNEEGGRLDFEFYSKSISDKLLVMRDSAMPENFKRTVMTQECLRRLLNTKKELGTEVQSRMKLSGKS